MICLGITGENPTNLMTDGCGDLMCSRKSLFSYFFLKTYKIKILYTEKN